MIFFAFFGGGGRVGSGRPWWELDDRGLVDRGGSKGT
jgi:hypothetical protein